MELTTLLKSFGLATALATGSAATVLPTVQDAPIAATAIATEDDAAERAAAKPNTGRTRADEVHARNEARREGRLTGLARAEEVRVRNEARRTAAATDPSRAEEARARGLVRAGEDTAATEAVDAPVVEERRARGAERALEARNHRGRGAPRGGGAR